MRRFRAAVLVLTALLVLAAGAMPACGGSDFCCKRAETPSLHAQMPCCQPSMSERDANADPTTAPAKHIAPVVQQLEAVALDTPPVEQGGIPRVAPAPQVTPPLFLLNEQFRI